MMTRFLQKFVMYPPRPDGSIPPDTIQKYPGWVGQRKWNGTRNLIFVMPDGSYELWNRHRQQHKQYKVSASMQNSLQELISKLERGVFHVFDSELMDAKTTKLKDKIVLYDVLVHDGMYLLGTTYKERYKKLLNILGNPKDHESDTGRKLALKFNKNLWLSEVFTDKLEDRFKEAIGLDEIEGLVLKDPNGKLEFGVRESNNGKWLIRVRKPHKNYEF
jgi:ATP-dependent DNA ligase